MHAGIAWPRHWRVVAFGTLITGLWLVFLAYWFVAAMRVKRSVSGTWKGAVLRVAGAVGILFVLRESVHQFWRYVPHAESNANPIAAGFGVVVCAFGIGIAIWARTHLGRNWGMPMSLREGHELVTTGPYAFVRHPIYTGILLAVVGTMLVKWLPWVALLAPLFAYFVYAAKVEERSMMRQFPSEYRDYMNRTKMLIPFLF